jgi:hypothetical protein
VLLWEYIISIVQWYEVKRNLLKNFEQKMGKYSHAALKKATPIQALPMKIFETGPCHRDGER